MKFRIVCITQIYNELRNGNLERFVKYVPPLVDALVVYDDASTDGSYEYMLNHTPHVIRGLRNDFVNEISHKKLMLDTALRLGPDFIMYLDADEVFTANTRSRFQDLCAYCVEDQIDGLSFHELNLWRSKSWRRVDSQYDDGWFVRLWRVTPDMNYGEVKPGLHQLLYPPTVRRIERVDDVQVIHYGFASERALAHKYLVYKSHGQQGWALDRLIDEQTLELEKVPQELFPEGLYVDDPQPQPFDLEDALIYVDRYREEVFKPGISVICLIYKSVKWLKFIYEQVLRYVDLRDKEFFFVANDADEAVLCYLRNHYIPHVVWNNSSEQRQEWYINNVYRAWNYGAQVARGDYLLFINSDMAFAPAWFERLFEKLDGHNCVASRLVESGKMPSGKYGISRDFGRVAEAYDESGFLKYVQSVAEHSIADGGLFMPLLIRREDFWKVGGYPEGNIMPGSDIFNPVIAQRGEPCVSGDVVLMEKLASVGIRHQTAFDSVVYHFQCGEMDEKESNSSDKQGPSVIFCVHSFANAGADEPWWTFLCQSLPSAARVDEDAVGENGRFEKKARVYIREHYPHSKVIVQDATSIDIIDPDRFTIVVLQDDLRRMGRLSRRQEENLRCAQIIVSNSHFTAASYREYDIQIIPIGVDDSLFHPMDRSALRKQLGFPDGTIGIFVGDFSEVKGWSKVCKLVEKRRDIFWILVSKGTNSYVAPNVRSYNRVSQVELAKLLNCANFFIVGSPVETQCLAAIEACMCNVPIVMRNVGIFSDWSIQDKARVGYFGEDFEQGIEQVLEQTLQPRALMLEKGLTVSGMLRKWEHLLASVHLRIASEKSYVGQSPRLAPASKPIYRRDPLWSKEGLKRELSYALPASVYSLLYYGWGVFSRGKRRLREAIVCTLRRILPELMYVSLRSSWRAVRRVRN
jgi:glycosyltransferase involved in cell wall biosynthesis